jgi:hypothetical protein
MNLQMNLAGIRSDFEEKLQRKPLTDEEITDLYFDGFSISKLTEFARAIEAAHGIKGEK